MREEAIKKLKWFRDAGEGNDLNNHTDVVVDLVLEIVSDMKMSELVDFFSYECDCPCNR